MIFLIIQRRRITVQIFIFRNNILTKKKQNKFIKIIEKFYLRCEGAFIVANYKKEMIKDIQCLNYRIQDKPI